MIHELVAKLAYTIFWNRFKNFKLVSKVFHCFQVVP